MKVVLFRLGFCACNCFNKLYKSLGHMLSWVHDFEYREFFFLSQKHIVYKFMRFLFCTLYFENPVRRISPFNNSRPK